MDKKDLMIKSLMEDSFTDFEIDADLEDLVMRKIGSLEDRKPAILQAEKRAKIGYKICSVLAILFILNYSLANPDASLFLANIVSVIIFLASVMALIWSKMNAAIKFELKRGSGG